MDWGNLTLAEDGVDVAPAEYTRCTYELDLLASDIPQPKLPLYYEIWNWEGDESILPGKWHRVVRKCFGNQWCDTHGITEKYFLQRYVHAQEGKIFDPASFFFLTHRSDVVATCFGWLGEDQGVDVDECAQKKVGMLHWLAVDPEHRKLGLGAALIQLVGQRLKDLGYARCRLRTESFRTSARRLYESQGFQMIREDPMTK